MGTILASAIVDKAEIQLIDTSNIRWTQDELLGWLNTGQRLIAQANPTIANHVAVVQLVAGTRQTIPADGFLFFEAYRNMGTDGLTAGRSVRIASREILDGYDRDWHSSTASAVTQAYLFNSQDNMAFYVYPPSTGTNYLEINYAKTPTDIAIDDAIAVPNIYENALLDYILGRAFSKDTEAGNPASAQLHFQMFSMALAADDAGQTKADANKSLAPGVA
jgi:hypothetical protein